MSNADEVTLLNDLTKTTLDSMKGYDDAAQEASDARFTQMFGEFSKDRSQLATRLQDRVRQLGGEPETSSSFIAAAHRAFMDLRNSVTGADDKAVIAEVDRGESYLQDKFQTAMRTENLSPETSALLSEAYAAVKSGHERIARFDRQEA